MNYTMLLTNNLKGFVIYHK